MTWAITCSFWNSTWKRETPAPTIRSQWFHLKVFFTGRQILSGAIMYCGPSWPASGCSSAQADLLQFPRVNCSFGGQSFHVELLTKNGNCSFSEQGQTSLFRSTFFLWVFAKRWTIAIAFFGKSLGNPLHIVDDTVMSSRKSVKNVD